MMRPSLHSAGSALADARGGKLHNRDTRNLQSRAITGLFFKRQLDRIFVVARERNVTAHL